MIANLDLMELTELRDNNPTVLLQGNIKAILLFNNWHQDMMTRQNGVINWFTDFTEDLWEKYLQSYKILPASSSASSSPPSYPTPTKVVTLNKMPTIKIDVKSYPEFNGNLTGWKSFKQQFTSIATIQGISHIMKSDYVAPTSPPEEVEKFNSLNTFLQSILTFALSKSTATAIVKKYEETADGRSSWTDIVKWFEGQGSQETLAENALTALSTHKLHANSHGRTQLHMEKSQSALQDLKDMKQPYDPKLAKINFLNNIQDEEYKSTIEILKMDNNALYRDALLAIRRKSISVENGKPQARQINRLKKQGTTKSSTSHINNTNTKPHNSNWIPADKWKSMSKSEKEAHIKKVKSSRNNKYSNTTPSTTDHIPPQYGNLNNAMTDKERRLYNMMKEGECSDNTPEELTPHQQKFINML